MKPLLAAIRFLTIVPVPGDWGTAEEDLAAQRALVSGGWSAVGRGGRRAGLGLVRWRAADAGRRRCCSSLLLELLRLPAPGRAGRHGRRLPEFPRRESGSWKS